MNADKALDYAKKNGEQFEKQLFEFLRFPSVSTQTERAKDVRACADWLMGHLGDWGITTRLVETPRHPIVYGEKIVSGDLPTLLFYGHYDVQPEDPVDEWISPPFTPTIRNQNVYCRGATDDKGQVFAFLKGIESVLKTTDTLPCNIKIVIEGEEEISSPHLGQYLEREKVSLKADYAVICDTSQYAPGVPAITYALRGVQANEITLYGPKSDLHSGMFGGTLQNPLTALAGLIAGLHDKDGRILIPGFYENVRNVEPWEREMWKTLPYDENKYKEELGVQVLFGEIGYSTLERNWVRPTCEINGLVGGYTGHGFKTVIGKQAHAKVSFRIVPDQDPTEVGLLLKKYLERNLPPGVRLEHKAEPGGKPVFVNPKSQGIQAASRAIKTGFGKQPVLVRNGASIPVVADFQKILGIDSLLVGLGLPDDNLHAPNEKFHLPDFHRGVATIASLLYEIRGSK